MTARSLLDVATVLARLDATVDPGQVAIDLTAGQLSIRAYDPAVSVAILRTIEDVRSIHGWEPNQAGRWHGALAGVVVRVILIDTRKDVAA